MPKDNSDVHSLDADFGSGFSHVQQEQADGFEAVSDTRAQAAGRRTRARRRDRGRRRRGGDVGDKTGRRRQNAGRGGRRALAFGGDGGRRRRSVRAGRAGGGGGRNLGLPNRRRAVADKPTAGGADAGAVRTAAYVRASRLGDPQNRRPHRAHGGGARRPDRVSAVTARGRESGFG